MIIEKFVDEIHMQRYKTLLDKAGDEPNKETACLFYVILSNDKLFEDVNKIYDFMNAVIKVYKRFKLSIQDKKMYNLALQLYDETLQHRVAICKRIERNALKQMEEIKRDGKLSLTDYFGECNPPTESKDGPLIDMLKVRNGIFFTSDKENFQFAVHEAITDNYMTPMAAAFAQRHGKYLFYDTTTA